MFSRLSLVFVLLTLAGCSSSGKKDEERIVGTWTVEKMTEAGEDKTKPFTLVITTTDFDLQSGSKSEKVAYKLDPSKKPAHLDLIAKEKGPPILGIYKFDGDNLHICFNKEGKKDDRPGEFSSTRENGFSLMIVKPKK